MQQQIVHEGVQCDECHQYPLLGTRYKCGNCTDYDLCESCEAKTTHDPTHVFVQLKNPLPDVYADMHAPLLSTKIYQAQQPINVTPPVRPITRLACKVAPPRPPITIQPRLACSVAPMPLRPTLACSVAPPRPPSITPILPPPPMRLGCAPPCPALHAVVHYKGSKHDIYLHSSPTVDTLLDRIRSLSLSLTDPTLQNIDLDKLRSCVTKGTFNPKSTSDHVNDRSICSYDVEFTIN